MCLASLLVRIADLCGIQNPAVVCLADAGRPTSHPPHGLSLPPLRNNNQHTHTETCYVESPLTVAPHTETRRHTHATARLVSSHACGVRTYMVFTYICIYSCSPHSQTGRGSGVHNNNASAHEQIIAMMKYGRRISSWALRVCVSFSRVLAIGASTTIPRSCRRMRDVTIWTCCVVFSNSWDGDCNGSTYVISILQLRRCTSATKRAVMRRGLSVGGRCRCNNPLQAVLRVVASDRSRLIIYKAICFAARVVFPHRCGTRMTYCTLLAFAGLTHSRRVCAPYRCAGPNYTHRTQNTRPLALCSAVPNWRPKHPQQGGVGVCRLTECYSDAAVARHVQYRRGFREKMTIVVRGGTWKTRFFFTALLCGREYLFVGLLYIERTKSKHTRDSTHWHTQTTHSHTLGTRHDVSAGHLMFDWALRDRRLYDEGLRGRATRARQQWQTVFTQSHWHTLTRPNPNTTSAGLPTSFDVR